MRTSWVAGWACLMAVACGGDASTDGSGGSGGGGGSGTGRPDPVQCGTTTCTGGDICMVRPQQPDCDIKQNPSDPCPTEKPNDTLCGGAGIACCCAAPPPPLYECDSAVLCGDEVTCECLTDACPTYMQCTADSEPGNFLCEETMA